MEMLRTTVNFTHEYNDVEYECECEVSYYTDRQYGADADGNRGAKVDFVESVSILDIFEVFSHIPAEELPKKAIDEILEHAEEVFYEG